MEALRTPDERFAGLPDFAFAPHYVDVGAAPALRLHYLDEGPRDASPVLLMHGEPSWSYLYRKMIPPLAAQGHRAVAPDLIGFGRSDKPARRTDYTFERHVDWMSEFLTRLNLTGITLFCQDWGGLIGLRLVARFPERFAAVIAANTGLTAGTDRSADLCLRHDARCGARAAPTIRSWRMKHATADALVQIDTLIEGLRRLPQLDERKPGIFYVKGKAFLHFHEDPKGLFADVKVKDDWKRFAINSKVERAQLLRYAASLVSK